MASTVRRNVLNSVEGGAKYETSFQLFMMIFVHFFMPVLNIYPAVYIWFDYMTNEELAYSPQEIGYLIEINWDKHVNIENPYLIINNSMTVRTISSLLLFIFISELILFALKCLILNRSKKDIIFAKKYKKLFQLR